MKIPKQRGIFRRVDSGSSVTTTSVITRILETSVSNRCPRCLRRFGFVSRSHHTASDAHV
ncbi:hypothetical protein AHF37_11474 [Paragonimus kellicotti]|nr:hypothetical protein AHF37_11474 [Paragonimus kellicotti]